MKTALLAAVLVLAAAPEFNRREPISLDLKDASVKEVITLLGALANLPVQIDPGVSGTVSVRVTDMPYERVLELVGAQNGLSIRIEGGKLVASTAARRPGAAAPDGPAAEGRPAGPRIPVEEYAKSFDTLGRLIFRGSMNDVETCAVLLPERGGSWRVEVSGQEGWIVSQFGWEPVTRTRFLAVEGPGFTKASAFVESAGASGRVRNDRGTSSWSISRSPGGEPCPIAPGWKSSGRNLRVRFEVRERRDEGVVLIGAPSIGALAETSFSTRSGMEDEFGQHREHVIFGFLSGDVRSVAAALVATATWKDPSDGREYVYAQAPSGEVYFGAPAREASVIGSLPAGAALRLPLDLAVASDRPD